jgi:maltooligosyltrehalose trehalohydrolase
VNRRYAWGPEAAADGASFRLWAPAARSVALAVGSRRRLAMREEDEGWWRIDTDAVRRGCPYAFWIDDADRVPDPAAREQISDVFGSSRLPDPDAHVWRAEWAGRTWEEAVVYELHVGTFTPEGDLDAAAARLPHLADLGVTAVELMPLAQFGGVRGWGYDGVLLYAPHRTYGGADALKRFVDTAHGLGLMVLLDVVYNHFGPEGNLLPRYAPDFFDAERPTPWGPAPAYGRRPVRDYIVQNAAYWIEEYRLDGLRLDAIDSIRAPDADALLADIADAAGGAGEGRPVHLITEDARNITRLHERDGDGRPKLYTAEWNDDFHHVAHVAATGQSDGYYEDYADRLPERLARVLSSGFDYQGQPSRHRGGAPRGVDSGHLPPAAFVDFLQNHDQVGNRAFGERLVTLAKPEAVEALTAILLLSPHVPLLFMGEEWGETRPFLFFADFEGELGHAVREGRRAEFAYWAEHAGAEVPDPVDARTFARSRLDWRKADSAAGRRRMALVRGLLATRAAEISPRLGAMRDGAGHGCVTEAGAVSVRWRLGDGAQLRLAAAFGPAPCRLVAPSGGARVLFETGEGLAARLAAEDAPGWSVVWSLEDAA